MYCVKCGKETKDEGARNCKYCGELFIERELDEAETRELSQNLYTRYNKSRETVDNALVFIVVGAILLIIGFLFLYLSQKLDQETYIKAITITCAEFWVSMVGLVSGTALFIIGWVRFIIEKAFVQKEVSRAIRLIQNKEYVHYKQD